MPKPPLPSDSATGEKFLDRLKQERHVDRPGDSLDSKPIAGELPGEPLAGAGESEIILGTITDEMIEAAGDRSPFPPSNWEVTRAMLMDPKNKDSEAKIRAIGNTARISDTRDLPRWAELKLVDLFGELAENKFRDRLTQERRALKQLNRVAEVALQDQLNFKREVLEECQTLYDEALAGIATAPFTFRDQSLRKAVENRASESIDALIRVSEPKNTVAATQTVLAPRSIPSRQRMGIPSLDVQRSFPPSRYSFSGGPVDPKLRADLYEEIGWLAREIQVLEGPPGLPPSDAVDRLLGRLTAQRGGEVDADYTLNEMRKHCRESGVHRLETGESSKAAAFEGFAIRIEGLQNRFAAPERPRERALSVRIASEESSATQIGRSKEGVMRIFPGQEFPKHMHHATKLPVIVNSAREQAELGPEWSEKYIFQAYPKCKYTWNEKSVTVKNGEEETALGKGWADTPGAFAPYIGPRKRTPEYDPAKWVAEWSLPGLSDDHRRKIKAQLIRVDGAFWKSPDAPSADIDALRQAFTGIAKVLSEAGILTEEILRDQILLLVWDSAMAGGWYRFASETPQDIFAEQLGHYWAWRDESVDWKGLFYSETREWLAWLLENPAPAHNIPGASKTHARRANEIDPQVAARAASRRAVIMAILKERRWKPGRLVTEAGVGKNSVYEYLDGTRAQITDKNREAIAQALGLMPDQLPD